MKNDNPHVGHRKRLRNQVLESGLDSLHEHQVLEYLLTFVLPQKDTNVIAHDLINHFGGFCHVFEASVNELKQVKGVGEVVAYFLYSFRDFFYYYQKSKNKVKTTISSYGEAKAYVANFLSNKPYEELYMICIDAKNKVVGSKMISRGTVNNVDVSLRGVTEALIKYNVSNFILAHNHPAGRCVPSLADDILTRAIYLTSKLNNSKMLDHIIIGEDETYSYFHDTKKMEDYNKYYIDVVSGKDPNKLKPIVEEEK